MKIILRLSIIALFGVDIGVRNPWGLAVAGNISTGPVEMSFVEEWEKLSADDANIVVMSKEQILTEVQKGLEAQKGLDSWEAKYRVTSRQAAQKDISVPEIINTFQFHLISDGARWIFESKGQYGNISSEDEQTQHYRYACNGETITMLWPDDKSGRQVKNAQEVIIGHGRGHIVDFMPCLPAASCFCRNPNFPEVLEILGDADTELLPWYARIGGQTCYVLEQITTLQQPVFRNKKDLERWKRENPEKAKLWSEVARYGLVFNIYPQGQPGGGDTRVIEVKFQLAIAPKLDFAVVCWAYGYGSLSGAYRGFIFPNREIKYGDFRKVSKDLFIPHQMVYTNYGIDRHGQRCVAKETRLTVEELAVNRRYEPELFEFDFPKGYKIIDAERGIIYTVGDSKEKIDALVAAAKARDAFYKKLSQEQAPALEPSEWLNSAPIILAEQKGKPIILHFWSLGCAPCIHELPQLQEQYGRTVESSWEPLFISIHPFADGQDMSQLKKVIKEKGITFPVMADSECTKELFWGKTFKKYMVTSVPNEITIDENGHISKIPEDYIHTGSWWMTNPPK